MLSEFCSSELLYIEHASVDNYQNAIQDDSSAQIFSHELLFENKRSTYLSCFSFYLGKYFLYSFVLMLIA